MYTIIFQYHCIIEYINLSRQQAFSLLLNTILLSKYVSEGLVIDGTLIARIVSLGISPVHAMFQNPSKLKASHVKPWSIDHILVRLLTNAF